MTIIRLRDYPDNAELASMYATAHDYRQWQDHYLRADITVAVGNHMVMRHGLRTAADLSCGNGLILEAIKGMATKTYGDIGTLDFPEPGSLRGPIEETIHQIAPVDLFVLSETLEHVRDPITVLKLIREKAKHLLLSTPDGELEPVGNPQHVWGWDQVGIGNLLESTGWVDYVMTVVKLRPFFVYDYQVWGATHE